MEEEQRVEGKGGGGRPRRAGVTDSAKVATPQIPKNRGLAAEARLDNLELTVGQNGASLRRVWGLD